MTSLTFFVFPSSLFDTVDLFFFFWFNIKMHVPDILFVFPNVCRILLGGYLNYPFPYCCTLKLFEIFFSPNSY